MSRPGNRKGYCVERPLSRTGVEVRERGGVPYRRVKDPKEIVVIFKLFIRDDADLEEYRRTSARMHELVETMPGFLSLKEYTGEDGEVIDIARFKDEAPLEAWRREPEHLEAQRKGREAFYDRYWIQALKVVREYEYEMPRAKGSAEA